MRIRLFGHYVHVALLVLVLVELLAFCAAYLGATAAYEYWFSHGPVAGAVIPRMLAFAVLCSLSFLALGLYALRHRIGFFGIVLRIVVALSAVLVLLVIVTLLSRGSFQTQIVVLAPGMALPLAFLLRSVAARLMNFEGFKKRILVYGHSARMAALTRMRRSSDRAGFHLVGVVHHSGDVVEPLGVPVYDATRGLQTLCQELDIDELVVALQDRRHALPIKELLECRFAGTTVTEFISFMERETGRIELDLLSPAWMIFGEGFRRDSLRLFTSRALDFVASGVLLILASPIMLFTALAIWLEDGRKGGSIFYRQNRVGFEGRVFPLIKFRSMRQDAEAGGAQWARKNDPRVTRVGAFLRKTRIDELPQLLNVLRGHMGFVGPRPERPEFVSQLEEKIPYYSYRHTVKPGLTGWAQINYPYGSSIEDAKQKLQYDLYYVKNNNLMFDLSILIQTVEVVLMGKGAR
jgi:sugar transferase (PEP-CTERM system associated)